MTAFAEMGVLPELAQAVEEMDWSLPTDVQAEAIPLILGGGDVLMAAETGSGKTGAFCLPIIQIVFETIRDLKEGKGTKVRGGGTKVEVGWKMNMYDRGDAIAIDDKGLRCQSRALDAWHGTRCMKGVHRRGAYYYEVTVTDEGLCRVGWSTAQASLDLGTDRSGYGFGGTGKKSFGKNFDTYGEPFGLNDVIGCLLDFDRGTVEWRKNGKEFGTAFQLANNLKGEVLFPACVLKNAELEFNFGGQPFKFPPNRSYVAVSDASPECLAHNPNTTAAVKASSGPPKPNAPYAVILEPSRELAEQTLRQVQLFKKHLDSTNAPRELLLIGGENASQQMAALEKGVDIVVATAGKISDMFERNAISFDNVRYFVLDEADALLSQGLGDLIQRIHKSIPKITADGRRLQMIVCSATLHNADVKKMADRLMHFPIWIDLKGQDSVPDTVHNVVCCVDPLKDESWREFFTGKNKEDWIATDRVHAPDGLSSKMPNSREMLSQAVKLLKGLYTVRAIDALKMDRALIFCRTKLDCDNMETFLNTMSKQKAPNAAYTCVCLHGDRKPEDRRANLEAFKRGQVRFMICTDVAARGLDISGLPYVINVTLPDEKANFVHRIGRVGRAERMGLAITLAASVPEKVWYHSSCPDRGRTCSDTRLTDQGGCCIWYNEPNFLIDIEDHLGVTMETIGPDFKVPVFEFDGKVVYGQKRATNAGAYTGHVAELVNVVEELQRLERRAQDNFLRQNYDLTGSMMTS